MSRRYEVSYESEALKRAIKKVDFMALRLEGNLLFLTKVSRAHDTLHCRLQSQDGIPCDVKTLVIQCEK